MFLILYWKFGDEIMFSIINECFSKLKICINIIVFICIKVCVLVLRLRDSF